MIGNPVNMEKEETKIRRILERVMDPEIPVLSVMDLGIVRQVSIVKNDLEIIITPTYSGCPAMHQMEWDIRNILLQHGLPAPRIITRLSPAWTTDWITEEGKNKLKEFGIAPPNPVPIVCNLDLFLPQEAVQCPRCGSFHTERLSQFGSTACKALYRCEECREPFDYFKCH